MALKRKKIKYLTGYQKTPKRRPVSRIVPLQQNIFQQARADHKAGKFFQAENLYKQILQTEPNQPDTLHYYGVLAYQSGRSEIAIAMISKALICRPDYVDAHNNLGIILHDMGRLDEAVVSFGTALKLKPDYAAVHFNLANAYKDQGKLDDAIASLHWVLALQPDYAEAHNNIGIIFLEQDKLDEALVHFSKALVLKPDYAEALYNLGNCYRAMGKLDDAIACFRKAVVLVPDDAESHFNLGAALTAKGKLNEAITSFRKTVDLKPDDGGAYYALGKIFYTLSKLDDAIACFRKAVALKPDDANFYNHLGIVLNLQGYQEEAITSFRQALTLKPDSAEVYSNLGCVVREFGMRDDAIACFKKALALKPEYAGAYAGLSSVVKFTEVDDVLQTMEHLYNKKDISEADRINLGFALGKAFEDLREYDRSFDFILEANRLKRKSLEYSPEDEQEFFEKIKKIFSAEFFVDPPGTGYQDKTPIFILGMPRSGTSLAEQILASHPLVFGAGELTVLEKLVNGISINGTKLDFPESILSLDRDAFERIGPDYIKNIRKYSKDAEHITDKMPYNFLHVGLIKTVLPAAKVIHCVRNPMDTCFSIFKRIFAGTFGYAYNMAEIGQYYNLYRDLMAHWEKVLPGFMYTLRYEEMVLDQYDQTKNLLDFCGLPWDEACLNFHKKERKTTTASFTQVRQPIYKDSVELWKRYESRLEPLKKIIYG